MTIAQASSFFDRTDALDPYSGALLFRCQIDPFEDTKRDAYSAYRRVMSVAPDVVLPVHRTVRIFGNVWILGEEESDGWSQVHRRKVVISRGTSQLKVSTLSMFLAGTHTKQLWAAPYWNKDAKQIDTSSEQPQMFDVFLPEAVTPRKVLWNDSEAYLTLSSRPLASGLNSAFSLKLDTRPEAVNLINRVFSRSAGEYTSSVSHSIPALRVRWQSLFEYDAETDQRYRPGDFSLVVPATATVDTSTLVEFSSGQRATVIATDTLSGEKVAHCRGV